MNTDQPPGIGSSPLSLEQRVDQACDDFEKAWRDGRGPRIEEYLAAVPEADQLRFFRELLALEIELRWNGNDTPTPEEYRRRFRQHGDLVHEVFADWSREAERRRPGSSECATTPQTPATDSSAVDPGSPSASASPPVPDHIGRYQVVRRLGGGKFGDVYLADDGVMDRRVAIKVPSAWLVTTERAKEEFLREARSVARLQHEGIVRAYDFGQEADGRCYIVYEFVDGESLAERIKPERIAADCVAPEDAARIVAAAAEALHYVHLQGMFHCDVKPANILLDRQGRPKVADLGLAVREEDLAGQRGVLAGTLPYMSPEQVRRHGHRLDGRSDIYSLGVVLYELLCGRCPFTGTTRDELKDQILHREARPPRQLKDSIPRELERICLKALCKQINDRYTTAGDMAEELRRAMASGPSLPPTFRQQATTPDSAGAGAEVNDAMPSPAPLAASCKAMLPRLLTVSQRGGVVVIQVEATHLDDEIDVRRFEAELRAALKECGNRGVVVDMSKVEHVTSSGMSRLIAFVAHVRRRGSRIKLRAAENLVQVLALHRVDRLFDSVNEEDAHTNLGELEEDARRDAEVKNLASYGTYVVQTVLGSGAGSVRYKGYQLGSALPVTVMVTPVVSDEQEEQCLKEVGRFAKLEHPGLEKLLDFGVKNGYLFVATDFLGGSRLSTWLGLKGHLPSWQETARLIAGVAEALAYLHAAEVYHGDVTPANIIVTMNESPILVLPVPPAVRTGIPGTPAYMAPEQVEGRRIDARADVYSLGVVLYELLCGRPPFGDSGPWERLRRVREEDPPPPRQLVPETPRDLEAICLKAIAKRVTDRCPTAADLAADLRGWLAASPAPGTPVSQHRKPLRGTRWKKAVVAAVAFAAVLAGLLALRSCV
jgi:serine/threonine protein kinase/ABC-type transporter Mla MlaB component